MRVLTACRVAWCQRFDRREGFLHACCRLEFSANGTTPLRSTVLSQKLCYRREPTSGCLGPSRHGQPAKLPIKGIAAVQNFYEVTLTTTGQKSEQVEQLFAQIEGDTKPLMDRLLKAETSIDLESEELSLLSLFMALLYLRGRSCRAKAHNREDQFLKAKMREDTENTERFRALTKEVGLRFDNDLKLEETRKLLHNFDEHFTLTRKRGEEGQLLSMIFETSYPLAEILFNKTWQIYESTERIFVTSDNPLTLMQYSGITPEEVRGFETGVVALPVSPTRCLLLEPGPNQRKLEVLQLSRKGTSQINGSTMFNAYREVYSKFHSKVTKKLFQKTIEGASEELTQEQIG